MSRLPHPFENLRRRLLARLGHRHGLPLREGNAVSLLEDGDAWLAATEALLRGARHHVAFEMYIWADDTVGRRVAALLKAALARGVRVRGVVDALGSHGARALVAEVEAAGAEIQWFHPVGLWRPLRIWNRRNHRKLLVVDGNEALVGSANWGEDYAPGGNAAAFIDLGLALRGPSVADLAEDMTRLWTRCGGSGEALGAAPGGPRWAGPWLEGATIQVVTSLSRMGARAIARHLDLLVRHCRETLWIANAYFLPPRRMVRALARAARRGVDVRLLLPGETDQAFVQAASRHGYGPLLRAGVRTFERQARMLHAKATLVDDGWVVVGTANLDPRSFRHNLEVNLAVQQAALAARMKAVFLAQAGHSHEVELADWRRRNWITRAWGRLAHAFRWWL